MDVGSIAKFFGFVSMQSTLWNMIGYLALIWLIMGVISKKQREEAFITAVFWLGAYAFVFLQDILIASFEVLLSGTAIIQYRWKISKRLQNVFILGWGIGTLYLLFFSGLSGSLTGGLFALGAWRSIGAGAYFFLLTGLVILPRHFGFFVMAVGGTALTGYAFVNELWVFFTLNAVFVIANLYSFLRKPKVMLPPDAEIIPAGSE